MILFLVIIPPPNPPPSFSGDIKYAFNIFWYSRVDHWSAEIPRKTISLLVGRSSNPVNSPKLYEYQYFSLLAELLLDLLVLPSLGRRACPATTVCVCALGRQSWRNHKSKRSLQTAALRGSDQCVTHLYLEQPCPDFSFHYLLRF